MVSVSQVDGLTLLALVPGHWWQGRLDVVVPCARPWLERGVSVMGRSLAGGQALERILLWIDREHPADERVMLEAGPMLRNWRMGERWCQSIRWMD